MAMKERLHCNVPGFQHNLVSKLRKILRQKLGADALLRATNPLLLRQEAFSSTVCRQKHSANVCKINGYEEGAR